MITKQIDFDGYNVAEVKHMYNDGQVVADVKQIEVAEDGSETILKQDTNIVFTKDYFGFTTEELAELKFVNIQQLVEEII